MRRKAHYKVTHLEYQIRLSYPTQSPLEIAQAAYALFRERYAWINPIRALTVRGITLEGENAPLQLDMFGSHEARAKRKALDDAVYYIHHFGNRAICAASLMGELNMASDKCDTVKMPGMMYT